MKALADIKEEFKSDHADQLAAVRSDIERLGSDLAELKDDLLDNKVGKQRRKKRIGSELWSHRPHMPQMPSYEANQSLIAGAASAGAIVVAAGAFAIWSSRPSAQPVV
ncbi:MAG: hypothetical protein RIQ28_1410 [Pseudomonadota bacterium]